MSMAFNDATEGVAIAHLFGDRVKEFTKNFEFNWIRHGDGDYKSRNFYEYFLTSERSQPNILW